MSIKELYGKKKDEGFTIIEVMIVLAIAGLIILIVFLAVPALQRNSRNTQRRNDVARLMGAVNDYVSNNNGALPAASCDGSSAACVVKGVSASLYDTQTNKVKYVYAAAAAACAAPADADSVSICSYAKCNGAGASVGGDSRRQYAAMYLVEGSGANTPQCIQS